MSTPQAPKYYKPEEIARALAHASEYEVSQLQLQKLVYFADMFSANIEGHHLIDPDANRFEAWAYGPVLRNLHMLFKAYMPNMDRKTNKPVSRKTFDEMGCKLDDIDTNTRNVCKAVYEIFQDCTAGQLVALTHRPGTAWSKVYREDDIMTLLRPKDIETEFKEFFYQGG